MRPLHDGIGPLPEFLAPYPAAGFIWIGGATMTPLHHDITNNPAPAAGRRARRPPGHQFNRLLSVPYFFSMTQSLGFLAKPKSHGVLTRKQNQMVAANDKAHSQIEGLVEAADQLASNVFVMGSHHLTLTVFADTVQALDRVVAQSRSDLADSGAVVAREDLGLEADHNAGHQHQADAAKRPRIPTPRWRSWPMHRELVPACALLHGYSEVSKHRVVSFTGR